MKLWTVGHSNRTPEAFLDLLMAHGIERLVDIRTVPRSRHNPWTATDVLPGLLAARGIAYAHLPALGGLRKPTPESPNGAWRNESFRGYADHMRTPEFDEGIDRLLSWAAREPTAIMCAEAVPWRCHRSLVADALVARGVAVFDILDAGAKEHPMTPFAKVVDGRVTYPPAGGEQMRLPI